MGLSLTVYTLNATNGMACYGSWRMMFPGDRILSGMFFKLWNFLALIFKI